jgi:hypothetical protein
VEILTRHSTKWKKAKAKKDGITFELQKKVLIAITQKSEVKENSTTMNKTIDLMHQKMEILKYGLLRVRQENEMLSVQVSTSVYDGKRLDCIFEESNTGSQLMNRDLVLIQKNGDDYFYITGRMDEETKKPGKVVSLRIIKACWFIRRKKDNVVWMQQKCVFELPEKKIS